MTCKFTPWILSKNHAEHISRTLLETNNEIAGAVIFDKQTTSSSKIIFTEIQQSRIVKLVVFTDTRRVMIYVNT